MSSLLIKANSKHILMSESYLRKSFKEPVIIMKIIRFQWNGSTLLQPFVWIHAPACKLRVEECPFVYVFFPFASNYSRCLLGWFILGPFWWWHYFCSDRLQSQLKRGALPCSMNLALWVFSFCEECEPPELVIKLCFKRLHK